MPEEPGGRPASDSSGVRFPPPVIVLIALGVAFGLNRLRPEALVSGAYVGALRLAGWLFLALWLSIAVCAVATFRRSGTSINPTKPTAALVERGPYRLSRNPMYVSLISLGAGLALLENSWWGAAALVPVILLLRYAVIAKEERYLEAKFGEAYRAYRVRVPRWF